MRRAALLVATGALLLGTLVFGPQRAGALAGSAGPVSISVVRTSGVADGQSVSVHATVPKGTLIYELRAHLCVPGKTLHTNFDFGFQGRRCTNAAVGAGDVERTAAFPSGVTAASLEGFKVGAGTVHWVNELGYDQTIDCGPGRPCDVVVRIQITNDTVFFTAPLCFGSNCPAEGSATPTTSHPSTGNGGSPASTPTSAGARGSVAAGAGGSSKTNPDGSSASGGSSRARAAGGSAAGTVDGAAGAAATATTIAAAWSLGRTLLVGLIGAIGGAAATLTVGRVRRRRGLRRGTIGAAAVTVVALLLGLSACSSSTKTADSSTKTSTSGASTTSTPAGTAKITSFVVPKSVHCGSAPSTTVRVTYAVSGAKSWELIIDGRVEPVAAAPNATANAPVHCDGLPHTVALVATDAAGGRTSKVENLTTVLPGG